mgnify:FL=1|tara:strand:+ start:256 stop:432 length:177 start_codon:yes stop_codon:yes gene_type:complete
MENNRLDSYYAMVDAKKKAKKYGGHPDDYIDDLMVERGYKKDTYSGHGVWMWVRKPSG